MLLPVSSCSQIFHAKILFLRIRNVQGSTVFRDVQGSTVPTSPVAFGMRATHLSAMSGITNPMTVLDWCPWSLEKVCYWNLCFLEHGIGSQGANTEKKWNYCLEPSWMLQLSYEEESSLLFVITQFQWQWAPLNGCDVKTCSGLDL